MRPQKWKNAPRCCRAGAGEEATKDKCDTPGFELRSTPAIIKDHKNFLKLEMPRNHPRLNQTPLYVLRGWRANCDIKILLYSTHVDHPDLEEIAQVSDYLVAYACKGSETLRVERDTLKEFILK